MVWWRRGKEAKLELAASVAGIHRRSNLTTDYMVKEVLWLSHPVTI